jgi:hypothetical protein
MKMWSTARSSTWSPVVPKRNLSLWVKIFLLGCQECHHNALFTASSVIWVSFICNCLGYTLLAKLPVQIFVYLLERSSTKLLYMGVSPVCRKHLITTKYSIFLWPDCIVRYLKHPICSCLILVIKPVVRWNYSVAAVCVCFTHIYQTIYVDLFPLCLHEGVQNVFMQVCNWDFCRL